MSTETKIQEMVATFTGQKVRPDSFFIEVGKWIAIHGASEAERLTLLMAAVFYMRKN